MVDIATVWNSTHGDWIMNGADLSNANDLETAVLISLFTDRVANPGDTTSNGNPDPRGWWGDNQPSGNTVPIGSRLWLLDRSKHTQKVLQQAQTYAQEALQWMIEDGVCARITVFAEWQAGNFLGMLVTIYRQDGTTVPLNFKWAWEQI